ncbi:hypothetical protein [Arthrobacter sp. NPDC057009]|uniref:hypothetical protein n=1 Tax=Arthrobacter sp. NPDC057009 TaxID=3345996 RepID=UPI00364109D9
MHMGDSSTSDKHASGLFGFLALWKAEREREVYPQYPGLKPTAKMRETLAAVAVASLVAVMLAVYFLGI